MQIGHLRIAKAQISLRIRAAWSGPSLSANTNIDYYKMNELIVKPGWYFAHAQDELNLRIWHMYEGFFSLDLVQVHV